MPVRRSTIGDLPAVLKLIRDAELPVEGVNEVIEYGAIVEASSRVVAFAAVERHGSSGLLRSVVVDSDSRGTGIGSELVAALLHQSSDIGLSDVYLLTLDAEAFFARTGFEVIERSVVPPGIRQSEEFSTLCPDSAVVMRYSFK